MKIGKLSPRQTEVYLQLAMGERHEDIAKKLLISVKTVDTHRGHVLKVLQLRNNTDLARYALAHGHVPPFGINLNPQPLPDIDYVLLDPGIIGAVRFLRHHGFNTTDSGDGYTKPLDERTIEGPHVFCTVSNYAAGAFEADRALLEIKRYLGNVGSASTRLLVEASYSSEDETCILSLTGEPLLRLKHPTEIMGL